MRCKFNYCCMIQYCPGGLAVYWRGLCRPERGQRGHTESHSWLVSLVRTRREDGDRGNVSAHGHSKGLETVSLKVEKKTVISYELRKRMRDL